MMMTPKRAEEIAVQALMWIAQDTDRSASFLGATGLSTDDLSKQAQNHEFLGFVLDFILLDDQNILALSAETDIRPEDVFPARQVLPGGMVPNWT